MSEVPQQTQRLIRIMREQTESGRRCWEEGSAATEFVFVHDAGSLIVLSVDGDGGPPFELRIVDSDGTLVEKYDSLDDGADGLTDLYTAAHQSVPRASQVVEMLLTDLDKDPGAELAELIPPAVAQISAAPNMDDKVALIKPLVRIRVEDLKARNKETVKWPQFIEPFPSGGGVHNALTQAFKEMRANDEIKCTVSPEPKPNQGFGAGKDIRFDFG